MIAVSEAVGAALATAGAVAAPPCSEPRGGGYLHQRLAKLASVKHGLPGRNWVNLFTYEWLSDLGIYRLTGTVSYRPALPAGLVASSDAYGVAVETTPGGLVGLDSLGYGPVQTAAAPWPMYPHAVVTAGDSAKLNANEQAQTVTDASDDEGTGSVDLSAVYFNAGGHSFGTGSDVGFGTTDSMSVVACATYSVLGAQTPEAPSALLLPASAAMVGLGALLVVRRRSRSSAV